MGTGRACACSKLIIDSAGPVEGWSAFSAAILCPPSKVPSTRSAQKIPPPSFQVALQRGVDYRIYLTIYPIHITSGGKHGQLTLCRPRIYLRSQSHRTSKYSSRRNPRIHSNACSLLLYGLSSSLLFRYLIPTSNSCFFQTCSCHPLLQASRSHLACSTP